MSDPLKKVVPGERRRVRADTHNAFVDAAVFTRSLAAGLGNGGGGQSTLRAGQVLVKNDSGSDRDRHDVLSIWGLAITAEDNEAEFLAGPVFSGGSSTGFYGFGKFMVLAEPVAAGQIGRAWMSGIFPARVTGEGTHADTEGGVYSTLRATPFGHAKILWSESGNDERWAVVRLVDPQLQFIGRALTDITSGVTGTVRVLTGQASIGTPNRVRTPTLDIEDVYNGGPDVDEDGRVEVKWINEQWEIGDGECPIIE